MAARGGFAAGADGVSPLFYVLSKLFWLAVQPLTVILVLMVLGLFAFWRGWRKSGAAVLGLAAAILFLGAYTTLGALMLAPLENRFARPDVMPAHVDGIIVLGGYMVGDVDASRGGYELNSAADRIVETMRLARLYPQAKIVVSGGAGAFFAASARDADSTRTLLHDLGFSGDRYIFENRSRNTVENARYSMALAQPKPGETWLLVTSAYHMPRAVGCFRAAGFRVTAWPVDYKTRAHEGLSFDLDAPDDALSRLDVAVREWIGLAAYRLAGKTGALLPGP